MKSQHGPLVFAALAVSLVVIATPACAANLWDIYQLALKNDPGYLQAEANYQAALENKPIARAGYLPNLTLNAAKSRSHLDGTAATQTGTAPDGKPIIRNEYHSVSGREAQYGAVLTQPLFDWARWERIRQADASVAEAEANFLAAQQALIVTTADAYFAVITARNTLAADHAATQANAQQLAEAKAEFGVGSMPVINVEQAQAAFDQSLATEIAARQQVADAEESLRAITAEPVGELQAPPPNMPLAPPTPANPDPWVHQAAQLNPSLHAAQAAAEVAARGVGIERAGHYPTLDLSASYSHNDTHGGTPGNANRDAAASGQSAFPNTADLNQRQLAVNLDVPVFAGGGVSAHVTQAKRQLDAAHAQVELVARQTAQQARTAYLGVLSGISRVKALRQSVESNRTALESSEVGLQVGNKTIVDVLLAVQNLALAQTQFGQARDNYLTRLLALKQAAGTLNAGDVKAISALLTMPAPVPALTPPASAATSIPASAMHGTHGR